MIVFLNAASGLSELKALEVSNMSAASCEDCCFSGWFPAGTELLAAHGFQYVFSCYMEDSLGNETSKSLTNTNWPDTWMFIQGNKATGCQGRNATGVNIGRAQPSGQFGDWGRLQRSTYAGLKDERYERFHAVESNPEGSEEPSIFWTRDLISRPSICLKMMGCSLVTGGLSLIPVTEAGVLTGCLSSRSSLTDLPSVWRGNHWPLFCSVTSLMAAFTLPTNTNLSNILLDSIWFLLGLWWSSRLCIKRHSCITEFISPSSHLHSLFFRLHVWSLGLDFG